MSQALVSIIVPVWNVEKYIGQSFRSLLEQSYSNIEYIVVDDASPDDSIRVVKELLYNYPGRKSRVKVIKHDINLGLGASRYDGYQEATGEYIINCDSDDWFEPTYIEDMVNYAVCNNLDVTMCNYFVNYMSSERHVVQVFEGNGYELLGNILLGKLQGFLWNKLIKRDVIQHSCMQCNNINMWEDVLYISEIAPYIQRVGHVPKALVHYNQLNIHSLSTQRLSNKALNDIERCVNIIDEKYSHTIHDIDSKVINVFKLRAKMFFLIHSRGDARCQYNRMYPETEPLYFKTLLKPVYANAILIAAYFKFYGVIDLIWGAVNLLRKFYLQFK